MRQKFAYSGRQHRGTSNRHQGRPDAGADAGRDVHNHGLEPAVRGGDAEKVFVGDDSPGFAIRLACKEVRLACEAAEAMGFKALVGLGAQASMERVHAWCDSPEYAPAKLLRQRASTSRLIVVEGVAPG